MIASEGLCVDQDEIFFERSRRSNDLALSVHGEATAIEYQLVITADLVDVDDGNIETTSGSGENLAAQCALAHVIRGGVDADESTRSSLSELFHRIAAVEAAFPKLLVVPGILTDGEGGGGAAERSEE